MTPTGMTFSTVDKRAQSSPRYDIPAMHNASTSTPRMTDLASLMAARWRRNMTHTLLTSNHEPPTHLDRKMGVPTCLVMPNIHSIHDNYSAARLYAHAYMVPIRPFRMNMNTMMNYDSAPGISVLKSAFLLSLYDQCLGNSVSLRIMTSTGR
ncbi:hypothetical protein FVEG_14959 [Fusarium verticillioides 7600]|uniref:Uncharacterized protein n=1 Tax=Gibberella moniliformis (strain M3125 / FGSC 7600) TaxID=334819 RepID=W7LTL1_GIBM7|nr:hypothetical protein FVEG_14959 [Fusarium verticillioides 7600]EWG38820.1 hypothetical protein FVEG_14959 [Fusarium verticillioides 7600]